MDTVFKVIRDNGYVFGGAVRDFLAGDKINDYDILYRGDKEFFELCLPDNIEFLGDYGDLSKYRVNGDIWEVLFDVVPSPAIILDTDLLAYGITNLAIIGDDNDYSGRTIFNWATDHDILSIVRNACRREAKIISSEEEDKDDRELRVEKMRSRGWKIE